MDTQSTTTPAVSAWKVYDAFGKVTSSSGTFLGPFGYGGGFGCQEEATGLKHLGHRMYDSSTGSFLTRDPIKDGRNWYVYCGNDHANWIDTGGLSKEKVQPGKKPPKRSGGENKWTEAGREWHRVIDAGMIELKPWLLDEYPVPYGRGRADLVDIVYRTVYEIKPNSPGSLQIVKIQGIRYAE